MNSKRCIEIIMTTGSAIFSWSFQIQTRQIIKKPLANRRLLNSLMRKLFLIIILELFKKMDLLNLNWFKRERHFCIRFWCSTRQRSNRKEGMHRIIRMKTKLKLIRKDKIKTKLKWLRNKNKTKIILMRIIRLRIKIKMNKKRNKKNLVTLKLNI